LATNPYKLRWNLLVSTFPRDVHGIGELPRGFEPSVIGAREEVATSICDLFPGSKLQSPGMIVITGADFSIQVTTGSANACRSFIMSVAGDEMAVAAVTDILHRFPVRAYDLHGGRFCDWTGDSGGKLRRQLAMRRSRDWSVEPQLVGRDDGYVFYHEKGFEIPFYSQFGGRDFFVLSVRFDAPSSFDARYPWAVNRKREILERVADELILGQTTNDCKLEIDEDGLCILLRTPSGNRHKDVIGHYLQWTWRSILAGESISPFIAPRLEAEMNHEQIAEAKRLGYALIPH
jgi:hypothetical protein